MTDGDPRGRSRVDADGVVRGVVPVGSKDADREVQITIEPDPKTKQWVPIMRCGCILLSVNGGANSRECLKAISSSGNRYEIPPRLKRLDRCFSRSK